MSCPCCGYLTVNEPRSYEVCAVCFWEDDPLQSDDPSFQGGANQESLAKARENFSAIGASAEKYLSMVRTPKYEEIPSALPST
jgi:Cysteine-rich CPCC